MRRALLSLLVPVSLALSACGGTPTGDAAKRVLFLKQPEIKALKDEQLAHLCKSLYPTDFLDKPKKYHYTKSKTRFVPSARETALAQQAGCTDQGTTPKK